MWTGRGGIERQEWRPLSYNRHISFCNVSYLQLTIQEMQGNCNLFIQTAFKCLKTLTELQVRCLDEDLHVVPLVASWTSVVSSLKAIRFASVGSLVSEAHIIKDAFTHL